MSAAPLCTRAACPNFSRCPPGPHGMFSVRTGRHTAHVTSKCYGNTNRVQWAVQHKNLNRGQAASSTLTALQCHPGEIWGSGWCSVQFFYRRRSRAARGADTGPSLSCLVCVRFVFSGFHVGFLCEKISGCHGGRRGRADSGPSSSCIGEATKSPTFLLAVLRLPRSWRSGPPSESTSPEK